MKVLTNKGTEYETVFDLEELGEDCYSLLAPYGVDSDEIDWPTDAQCSEAAGVTLRFFDAGDHPKRAEAILRVIRDEGE